MKIAVYEDEKTADLFPITLTRPAFQIPVGGWTLEKLLKTVFPDADIRFYIRDEMTPYFDYPAVQKMDQYEYDLTIMARSVPGYANMVKIKKGQSDLELMDYAHQVIIWHKQVCRENLELLRKYGNWHEVRKNIYVGQNVRIHENVHMNADDGLILIDDNSEIFPFTVLEGPLVIGKGSRILEHSVIKDRVTIGDVCKVRGEVTEAIIMDYSNKQHYGFLGNAFVGEWVNLGAGTCNSDLKNTYGEIRVKRGAGRINSGEQFLGCVIGDYSKSAINTSIFTGKTIGVSSYLYGFIDEDIPSFVSYMKHLGCRSNTFKIEKAVETQKRMFIRRKRPQEPKDIALLEYVFEKTHSERESYFV